MASPAAADSDSTASSLSFTSLNDDKPITIVLLHGGFTCRLEFALVTPHLSDFHLLLPDLPLHSASRHIQPGTTDHSASHVARLIRDHAHGGKAHVVGVSMGGYIAQCLALDQPELLLSLFVTGANPIVGERLFMARWPSMTYYIMRIMLHWLPDWAYRYQISHLGLKLDDDLLAEMRDNITWPLCRDMFPWILLFTMEHVQQLKVRTLSIAGGKPPKGDDVGMAEKTAVALRSRRTDLDEAWPKDGSGAVVIREATHAWDMQFPELFAQGVSAWVSGQKLPKEFERLG